MMRVDGATDRSLPGQSGVRAGAFPAGIRGLQESFASILARDPGKSRKKPEEQARDAAEKFVSISLVQPLLAQLRENSQAAPPFAPSNGEKQFRAMLDAHIAQEITHAARFPLVDGVARRLLRNGDGRGALTGAGTP
jgi:Rod binding domain-containing protein